MGKYKPPMMRDRPLPAEQALQRKPRSSGLQNDCGQVSKQRPTFRYYTRSELPVVLQEQKCFSNKQSGKGETRPSQPCNKQRYGTQSELLIASLHRVETARLLPDNPQPHSCTPFRSLMSVIVGGIQRCPNTTC